MNYLWRGLRILTWVVCLSLVGAGIAQEQQEIRVAGSGIVLPIVSDLAATANVSLTTQATGSAAGLAALCANEADVVATTRAMTVEEDVACSSAGVAYREFSLGANILAFVANPADSINVCLTQSNLDVVFAPSSRGRINNWGDAQLFTGENPPAFTFYLPADDTASYALLDRLVAGDGLRTDFTVADAATALEATRTTSGVLAAVSASSNPASEGVFVFDVNLNNEVGCVSPSIENVEAGSYLAADRFFLYVNETQIEALNPLLSLVVSAEGLDGVLAERGFSAPSAEALALNQASLGGEDTRPFSREVTGFTPPDVLLGEIVIGGATHVLDFMDNPKDGYATSQPNFTVTTRFEGVSAGLRRLCNGELDIVMAYSSNLTEEQQAACTANNITLYSLPLGAQAAVIVVNEANAEAVCLTTQQITTLWGANSTEIKNWRDVSDTFADLELVWLGIPFGNALSDVLLQHSGQPIVPVRASTEENTNALYRAEAVSLVQGAITYMTWQDYQRVLTNNQAGIRLVSVDNGQGCIEPTEANILDGTYPLSRGAVLLVPQTSMQNPNVQAYLWQMFQDDNSTTLTAAGLLGISVDQFPELRATLERDFALAEEAAETTQVAPEVTPEPSVETTPEPASSEATPEAEATAEATSESN